MNPIWEYRIFNEIVNNINASKRARTMNDISQYIDNIYTILFKFIHSNGPQYIDRKGELYKQAIKFMLEYFPDLTYKKIKPSQHRKIYNNMLRELTEIYIYNPQAKRIQMKMFKNAAEYVNKRQKKY